MAPFNYNADYHWDDNVLQLASNLGIGYFDGFEVEEEAAVDKECQGHHC